MWAAAQFFQGTLLTWHNLGGRQVAHLAQHHTASGAHGPGATLAQRSYLGPLLPESLLHVLDSYGPGAFAAALAGDSDTPELVWTHRMRAQRLVPQVRADALSTVVIHLD